MSRVPGMRGLGAGLALLSVLWTAAPPIFGDGHWINDGSASPPRLSVEQAIWAMGRLPRGGQEWSREQQVAKIAAAGFDGFMVFLPREEEAQDAYRDLAAKHRLQITLQCAPSNLDDLAVALKAVERMNARGLVAMIRPTFVTFEGGARKIRDMMAASREAKVPFYVETHRGTITQDLLLTGRWAREIPGVQIHADLSHFVISYGVGRKPSSGPIKDVFDAVLARTGMIDGRVGNGQQVQIDIGPAGDSRHAAMFADWWKQGMKAWLEHAKPGDVFVFKSELGPPAYSIVGLDGVELSDRWAQALVMRDLGIRTWNRAVNETGKGQEYKPGAGRRVVAKAGTAEPKAEVERPKDWGKWPAKLEPTDSKIRTLRGISHKLGEFYLSGQPAQPDFATAKEEGVKTVINVRLDRELFGLAFDVQFACEDLGLKYIHMPIGPETFDDAQAEKFLSTLREAEKPVLIHGSNGNRVWGLWALYMGAEYGVSVDDTAARAGKLGVKKLVVDEFVRDYLKRKG